MCDHPEKVRYSKKKHAMAVARKHRKKQGDGVFAYYCEYHNCWHIGHHTNREFLKAMGRGPRGFRSQTS